MPAKLLLIAADGALYQSVRKAIGQINSIELDVVGRLDSPGRLLESRELALVFFHLSTAGGEAQLVQVYRTVAAAGTVAVVAISDEYDLAQAVRLLRLGVADYLARPLNLGRVALLADVLTWRARHFQATAPTVAHAAPSPQASEDDTFLCRSPEMVRILEQVRAVAPLDTTILLTGETGTGKTRLARLIHEQSPRRSQPFLVVNCGALASSLIESEMFGHVKGAFTGADRDHSGKFASAAGGTLMLDEIDTLPLATQSKLLRAVDERIFEPVGSNQSVSLRARLIVATNRCLEEEVAAGRFRSDLYYRVNVVPFRLPPLRERRALIEPLVRQCIVEFAHRHGARTSTLSAEALAALSSYDWPSNLRELRNVIERAVALCHNARVELSDLPDALHPSRAPQTLADAGEARKPRLLHTRLRAEADAILGALAGSGNNRARAARELGISRVTLYKKLHKHGLM